MPTVLIVDDDPPMLRYLRSLLECAGFQASVAGGGEEALAALRNGPLPDAILLDLMMPGMDGLETLEHIRNITSTAKVIMLSGHRETPQVVQAIKLGALDYLTKPVDEAELMHLLGRCLQPAPITLHPESELVEELEGDNFFLAVSPAMRRIFAQIERIAKVEVPVLITGESGTGKEIISLLLHKFSPRSKKRFLKVNCAAIPEDLLESELFGYEPGAFTGASHSKPGQFELCDKGTILLDEIGEMPPRLQAKLLQVLQEQRFFRLGGRSPVAVDVRILAATNVNIESALKYGKLRVDLYYRLNAFSVHVPPLRERREEIAPLFQHFMKRLALAYQRPPQPLTERLSQACMQHAWPGNVRELHNLAKRYLVLGDDGALADELRASSGLADRSSLPPVSVASGRDLKQLVREMKGEAEAEAIRRALEHTRWKRKDAAEMLGISYKALIYKARQYNILRARPQRGVVEMFPKNPQEKKKFSVSGESL